MQVRVPNFHRAFPHPALRATRSQRRRKCFPALRKRGGGEERTYEQRRICEPPTKRGACNPQAFDRVSCTGMRVVLKNCVIEIEELISCTPSIFESWFQKKAS